MVIIHCSQHSVGTDGGGSDFFVNPTSDKPVKPEKYPNRFPVTSDLLEDPKDLWQRMLEQAFVPDKLRIDLSDYSPPTYTKFERFRRWLGWKVWDLAVKINPDVADL